MDCNILGNIGGENKQSTNEKMSEGNKWKSPESAPKDGNPILADVGYPWAVIAVWNSHDEKWVYASLQACEMANNTVDTYFENEQESEIKGWMPMPELPESKALHGVNTESFVDGVRTGELDTKNPASGC